MKALVTRWVIAVLLLPLSIQLNADDETFDVPNKVIIQVSSNDEQVQTLALNNAVNVQKAYGMDNVSIVVVAYGPGLSIMTSRSPLSKRVSSLAQQNIRFNACGNTLQKMTAKTGKKPQLTEGVTVVATGVGRIMELQQQGYAYIRP